MSLAIGARIGAYEILSLLGAGGMGEVYRAHDTTLNRNVALKVLLPEVADNPERLARFRREAQILASLNHPNIAHIYGLEESDGVVALVLELVEGPTLADRIAKGPIPLDAALPIAKQIAEALEAAHDQGIIHRDLKPANIKVREDGTVKVLDFGLAKAMEPVGTSGASSGALANSPTITSPAVMTRVGVLLGTAAYMSPEQARGQAVDRRADLWSFGVVFYEMLTGRRLFGGDDLATVVASVLTSEPDWVGLPPATPMNVRALLRRCLQRDPRRRFDSAAVVRIELSEPEPDNVGGPRRPRSRFSVALASSLLALAVIAGVAITILSSAAKTGSGQTPVRRIFPIVPPSDVRIASDVRQPVALSRDGRVLVIEGVSETGAAYYVRRFDQPEFVTIPGTSRASTRELGSVFLSPDGAWIGFVDIAGSALCKLPISGGTATQLVRLPVAPGEDTFFGAAWGTGRQIVYSAGRDGIFGVSEDGGDPHHLITPSGGIATAPSFLPDGVRITYKLNRAGSGDVHPLMVFDPAQGEPIPLEPQGDDVRVAAGHLLVIRANRLLAAPFDTKRLRLLGPLTAVFDNVARYSPGSSGNAWFVAADDGALAAITAAPAVRRTVTVLDWHGHATELPDLVPSVFAQVRVSPDERTLALGTNRSEHIWRHDLATRTTSRMFMGYADDRYPVWSPDGKRLFFTANVQGTPSILSAPTDSSGEPQVIYRAVDANDVGAEWLTADGKSLVFYVARNGDTDMGELPLDGGPPKMQVRPDSNEGGPRVSPDGRMIAYHSNVSGVFEIYIEQFPEHRGRVQVSGGGGRSPVWSRDGTRLAWVRSDGSAVIGSTVRRTDRGIEVSDTQTIAEGRFLPTSGPQRVIDSTPGDHLMVLRPASREAAPTDLMFLDNWLSPGNLR